MTAKTGRLHPSARGLVALSAWVEPSLRERVRRRAAELNVNASDLVARAVERELALDDTERRENK